MQQGFGRDCEAGESGRYEVAGVQCGPVAASQRVSPKRQADPREAWSQRADEGYRASDLEGEDKG